MALNLAKIQKNTTLIGNFVGVTGIEPVTSAMSMRRSNQLSYTPESSICGRGWNRTNNLGLIRTLLRR